MKRSASRYDALASVIGRELSQNSLRTGSILLALQRRGVDLDAFQQALFAPRTRVKNIKTRGLLSALTIRNHFVAPSLRAMRGERTLAEASSLLGLKNVSTLHHWESGRRETPFAYWLQAVDAYTGRLNALIGRLPFEVPAELLNGGDAAEAIQRAFFSQPWAPTLLLALRLPRVFQCISVTEQVRLLCEHIEASQTQIQDAIDMLLRCKLIRLEGRRLVADPAQFYAISGVPPEQIDRIHRFWFSQAPKMLNMPGLHKVEQHAMSRESKEKVIQWIGELRERIRLEVKDGGDPETLVHIHWQVAELL